MSTYKASIIIRRPVEDVFNHVADLDTWSEWRTEIVELKDVSANPLTAGATFTVVISFMDRPMDIRYEVTEFEANKKLAFRSPGNFTIDIETVFEEVELGTRIRHRSELSSGGAFRLVQPLVARTIKSQVGSSYVALKKLLEAQ